VPLPLYHTIEQIIHNKRRDPPYDPWQGLPLTNWIYQDNKQKASFINKYSSTQAPFQKRFGY